MLALILARMNLRDFFEPQAINLNLAATAKEDVIAEMVALLRVDERAAQTLVRLIQRREQLGSTGIGRGVAVPHCRSMAVSRLRVGLGLSPQGIAWEAVDQRPVHAVFLIVAPPNEVSNQYLPVLGKIAQLAQQADVPERLTALGSPEEFLGLLEEKGI